MNPNEEQVKARQRFWSAAIPSPLSLRSKKERGEGIAAGQNANQILSVAIPHFHRLGTWWGKVNSHRTRGQRHVK
jgi:hypothetical protein